MPVYTFGEHYVLDSPMMGNQHPWILPSSVLARYMRFFLLEEGTNATPNVIGGRDYPRVFTPLIKAQEVLYQHEQYGVLVEEEHAVLWLLTHNTQNLPLEQALEEIRLIFQWRMVQPILTQAHLQELEEVFSTRPRFWERLQSLIEKRRALEVWLQEERMDLARLYTEAAPLSSPDAWLVASEDRFFPRALATFLSRFPRLQRSILHPSNLIALEFARTEAEAHAVAQDLRLHPPQKPHRVVIALGDLSLLTLYERVLRDYGIPFLRPGGPLLTSFPEFHLLDAAVALLESPDSPPEGIRERIFKEFSLHTSWNDTNDLPPPFQNLCSTFKKIRSHSGALPVSQWVRLLENFLHESVSFPISPQHAEIQERIRRLLEEIRFAVEVGGDPPLSPRSFRLLLHRFARKFRVPEEEEGGGVWLVPLEDIPPEGERLYGVALSEQAFPRYPYHPWIPLRHVHRFGWPPPSELYRTMKNRFQKDLQGYQKIWLSFSRLDAEDREVAPSPILIPYLGKTSREGSSPKIFLPWEEESRKVLEFPLEGIKLEGEALAQWQKRLKEKGLPVTSLVTYERCPLQFYFSVVEKIPDWSPPPVFPTPIKTGEVFHRAYEEALRPWIGRDLPSPKEIVAQVRKALPHRLPKEENLWRLILQKEVERLLEGMEVLEDQLQRLGYTRLVDVENSQTLPILGIPISGRWDRIMAGDDGEIVLDYKTGRIPTRPAHEAQTTQLEVYMRMRPHATVAAFLYPAERRLFEVTLNQESKLEDVVESIYQGNFPVTPTPEVFCYACPYARICPIGREYGVR